MIQGFEEITKELSKNELNEVLPGLVRGLQLRIGKENAITNSKIVEAFRKKGIKTSSTRIRKMINAIRITGAIMNLVSSSVGYYITLDVEEAKRYNDSLMQRADAIYNVAKAMDFQRKMLE